MLRDKNGEGTDYILDGDSCWIEVGDGLVVWIRNDGARVSARICSVDDVMEDLDVAVVYI